MVTKNKSPERDDAQLFFSMLNRSDKSGTLIDRVNNRCCFYTVFFTGKLSKYTVSVRACVCVCVEDSYYSAYFTMEGLRKP